MTSPYVIAARRVTRELHGIVVSSGLMDKTVKVRVGTQKWNSRVSKWFSVPQNYLVHDPNNSLRTGDVVAITPGWRTSSNKRHIVKHIIAPAGTPIEERSPVPSLEERIQKYETKKAAKDERREERRAAEIQKRIAEKQARNASLATEATEKAKPAESKPTTTDSSIMN